VTDAEFGIPGVVWAPGDHICAFYTSPADRDAVMFPFLRSGLMAGDRCVCILDGADPAAVLGGLGPQFDPAGCVAAGQLELHDVRDSQPRGGGFSTDRMLTLLAEKLADPIVRGRFRFTRTMCDAACVLAEPPGADEFFRHESELNRFAHRHRVPMLWFYDLNRFGGDLLVNAIKTHPRILVDGALHENPHCLAPDQYRLSAPPATETRWRDGRRQQGTWGRPQETNAAQRRTSVRQEGRELARAAYPRLPG
jgi:hypothetical protein